MKKPLLSLLLVFITLTFCTAQTTFQKTFGSTSEDMGTFVQQTADGGYMVAGYISNGAMGDGDVFVARLNANGDTLWTKNIGGADGEGAYAAQLTTDGGLILTGFTGMGTGDVAAYLLKTDADGNPVWSKTFGGVSSSNGYCVRQTADGGYIIGGVADNFITSDESVMLIKTDANGDTVWTKNYNGNENEEILDVLQTTDGGYLACGSTGSFGTPGQLDVWLIRTNANGDTLWTKTLGGTDTDEGHSIVQTPDGGFVIAGRTSSFGAGSDDFYLIKTDSSGNPQWSKTYGGSDSEESYGLEQTTDGGFLITGDTRSFGAGSDDIYVVKTNANGDTLWTRTFGGTGYDIGLCGKQTTDGGYIFTGLASGFGAGQEDIYIIKTDANGNSGCQQRGTATVVTTPTTTVAGSSPVVSHIHTATTEVSLAGSGVKTNTLCVTVGLNEVTAGNSFLVYPNPSTGSFNLTLDEMMVNGEVEVFNVTGASVFKEYIQHTANATVNLKDVSAGIYFVKVFNGATNSLSKIIIAQD